ncbi:MAG: glycosyltransferase, partial [Ilumatobacteraceae bacterium]
GSLPRFGWAWSEPHEPIRWTTDPTTGHPYPAVHWTEIRDDDPTVGDIKDVWEPSRLGATFLLARAWAWSGDDRWVEGWWQLLESWLEANPPNTGVNWRCAQESSLRAIAVQFGLSTFAGHPASTPPRLDRARRLLGATVERVTPTVGYALSQRNNHAVSELVFLLSLPGGVRPTWVRLLREVLRDQFLPDGSYSQQSLVYEQLAVHALCWLLQVQPELPGDLRREIDATLDRAATFMARCADPVTGQWPNAGPNDGALLLDLAGPDRLDARPTLALLGMTGPAADGAGEMGCWFTPTSEHTRATAAETTAYRTMRGPRSLLVTHVGRGPHRAAHDDQQAVELFIDGERVVHDPGTFRYTASAPWGNPLVGVEVHATLRPLRGAPRATVGRFLREPMPTAQVVGHHTTPDGDVMVSRRHDEGVRLTRTIVRSGDRYAIVDDAAGGPAVVRWNLTEGHGAVADLPGAVAVARTEDDPASGWWCTRYARRDPADVVEVPLADGGRTIARFGPKDEALLSIAAIDAAIAAAATAAAATVGHGGRPRSVLVLNHFAQPRSAPGGTRHAELFSRLDGWSARVITSNRNLLTGERIVADGVLETVWTSRYRGNGAGRIVNWMSYAVTSFVRGVRARPLDVVYGSSPHLLAGLSAWCIAAVRRRPFVLEIRDVWPQVLVDMGSLPADSVIVRVLERLETFLYRRAASVVVLAEGVRAHVQRRGVPAERIVYIPNGADPADMTSHRDRDELRRAYGFDGVVAIYAGAHGPANGLDLLLDAAAAAHAAAPALTVVLVGDGAEKERLVRRATDEAIGNVRFLDPVPKSEMADLLAAADIGVHCLADVELFRAGVSPNKLFDYMAAGRAAITNTPGLCSAYVDAAGAGLAVPPNGLADGLVRLTALDDAARDALGDRGRAHIAATQSRTAMAARLTTLLNRVVDGHEATATLGTSGHLAGTVPKVRTMPTAEGKGGHRG